MLLTLARSVPRYPIGDSAKVGSPAWWLVKLNADLTAKQGRIERLRAYRHGQQQVLDLSSKGREAFAKFQQRSRMNLGGLTVDTMKDAARIVGIRTGVDGEEFDDAEAWAMWQANGLDADSPALHDDAFTVGEGFAIVGQVDPEIDAPLVTIEDPALISIARDPLRRRSLRAALKQFTDEWTGDEHAYLYLRRPGQPAVVARAQRNLSVDPSAEWTWIGDGQALPFAQLPIVWFPNRLASDGRTFRGEFEDDTDLIDRHATSVLQRLVIGAMQAMRQRVVKNLPDKHPDGSPITDEQYAEMFAADPAAMWMVPKDVEFWESTPTDPTWLLTATKDDIKDYAAATRTPLPALLPDAANQASQNVELVRYGFEAKMLDRIAALSQSHEQIVQLMYLWRGDTQRARRTDMEMLWEPLALPSLAERFDAVSKAQAAGMDPRWVMANVVGMSPQELRRYWRDTTPEPVKGAGETKALSVAEGVQKVYLAGDKFITSDEARKIINDMGGDLSMPGPEFNPQTPAA